MIRPPNGQLVNRPHVTLIAEVLRCTTQPWPSHGKDSRPVPLESHHIVPTRIQCLSGRATASQLPHISRRTVYLGVQGGGRSIACAVSLLQKPTSAVSRFTVTSWRQLPSTVAGLCRTPVRARSIGAHSHSVSSQKGAHGTCSTDEYSLCSLALTSGDSQSVAQSLCSNPKGWL